MCRYGSFAVDARDDLRRPAKQVERLRPPGHRDPEAFWRRKSDIAYELRELADRWTDGQHGDGRDRERRR